RLASETGQSEKAARIQDFRCRYPRIPYRARRGCPRCAHNWCEYDLPAADHPAALAASGAAVLRRYRGLSGDLLPVHRTKPRVAQTACTVAEDMKMSVKPETRR